MKTERPNAPQSGLLMIGPFPPPVHGQSAATLATAEMLEAGGLTVSRCDTGEGEHGGKLQRLKRLAGAFRRLASASEDHVYISANANRGMALTWLMCALARARGKSLTLHHHAYNYIGTHSGLAERMAKAAGPQAMHLTQCRGMGAELADRYPVIEKTLPFSNVGFVDEAPVFPRPVRPVTLGHLSNLTQDKGLGRVVECLRAALARNLDVRLVVAGPCSDAFARDTVASAKKEFGDRFEYRGPVYGEAKQAYFQAIDLFLFPTRYRNETQGIVNLEALACGVPVAAFDQCCVGETVGQKGGLVVESDADFAQNVLSFIAAFEADPEHFRASAREQFEDLRRMHETDAAAILDHFKRAAICAEARANDANR